MPYSNVPKSQWGKMERCVARVKASGRKVNAHAVCHSSIVGGGVKAAAKRRAMKKGG